MEQLTIRINTKSYNWHEIDVKRAKQFLQLQREEKELVKQLQTNRAEQYKLIEQTRNEFKSLT